MTNNNKKYVPWEKYTEKEYALPWITLDNFRNL